MSDAVPETAYGPEGGGSKTAEPEAEAPTEDVRPRCWRCNRLLAEWLTRPWRVRCSRCKAENSGVLVEEMVDRRPKM